MLALLEAMERRDYITSDEPAGARRQLRASGALGTEPTTQELIEDARLSGFGLTGGLANALLDPTVLRVRPGDVIHSHLDFLREVFGEAPDRFDEWVARVLDGLQTLLRELPLPQHAENLALLAWQPFEEADSAFFQALIRALRSASAVLGPLGDPVLGATRALATVIDSALYPTAVKLAVMRTAIDRLPIEDRNRMRLAVFTPNRPAGASGAN